jgi:hypothetical protein
MLHPSAVVNIKKRIIFAIAVKLLKIRCDTFVFLCRDLEIPVGKTVFLLEFYYRLDPAKSKKMAFSSSAWGDKAEGMVRLNEEGFDYLVELSKEQKK